MISIEEARKICLSQRLELQTESLSIEEAQGRFLAKDLTAELPHPFFDVSAVDGYAFRAAEQDSELKVIGEVPAGSLYESEIPHNCCVRIFTGATVPKDCDTVIMQEFSERNGDHVSFNKQQNQGANIRKSGGQIRPGDIIFKKGERINASALGLLRSLGIHVVSVYRKIRINCIVTGSEFANSIAELEEGKIFDSNGLSLEAEFRDWPCEFNYQLCQDDLNSLTEKVKELSEQSDLLILTGGVSVGDYDFSRAALEANNFDVLFHKVKQKPGKPLLLARQAECVAFGLPGNPRSVLISLELYIKDWMKVNLGANPRKWIMLPLKEKHKRRGDRAELLSATYEDDGLKLNEHQASHMLQSLARADYLIHFQENKSLFKAGDLVECLDLRNGS